MNPPLLHRTWLRLLLWGTASFLTLLVVLLTWLNWSGARRLQTTRSALEAQGESLDFRRHTRDPLPPESNFCSIEALRDLAAVEQGDVNRGPSAARRKRLEQLELKAAAHLKSAARPDLPSGSLTGKAADLKAWAAYLGPKAEPAADPSTAARWLLELFKPHEPLIAELIGGLNRQGAQWTPEWRALDLPERLLMLPVPHYNGLQKLQQLLLLRGCAATQLGEADKAMVTLHLMLRLAQASFNDPFLIGHLVGLSQLSHACNLLWEITHRHLGRPEDYQQIRQWLAAIELRRSFLHTSRGELAMGYGTLVFLRNSKAAEQRRELAVLLGGDWLTALMPKGWYDLNAARLIELELQQIIVPLREKGLRAAAEAAAEMPSPSGTLDRLLNPGSMLASMIMPGLRPITAQTLRAQALIDLANTACALEQWRGQQGSYPKDLAQLANTTPLPADQHSGKALHYRLQADGSFRVWCIGPDLKDDQGNRGKFAAGKITSLSDQGDWVWGGP